MNNFLSKIDNSWTLFLDRDGVINRKLEGDYVKTIEEFEFLPNSLKAIVAFSNYFHKIIVVTNQQGISKKLMTENDLSKVHNHLHKEVEKLNGRIDAIYHAPQLESENSIMRKPNTGMAHLAQKEFPSIEFSKSIMVGDSISDMEFAKNAGMNGLFIGKSNNYKCIESLNDLRLKIKR
ncbi:HAD family hydrolase [Flavobacteriales bacterium]|jgi:histidinol-phosphate phosphatase family protein|nr:HAD family hydrolase [Flavobacteriales bacterium]MDB2362655.1 HAD family hydrolase [Flavobacteriales bacterium]